jgi:hypothetical protein
MKRLVGIMICSIVMSVGLMAAPAAAEPHGWNLYCRSGTGIYSYVSSPEQCRQGNVQFLSWTTGEVDGSISIWALEQHIVKGYTLDMLYSECQRHIICGIAMLPIEAFVLSKLRLAYIALKALL